MFKRKSYFLLIFILFFDKISFSQFNKDEAYSLFVELSNKSVVDVFADILPMTCKQIAKKLVLIEINSNKLTVIQKKRLEYLMAEYAFEVMSINNNTDTFVELLSSQRTKRMSLFKFYSFDFSIAFDPVLGVDYNLSDNNYSQFGGVRIYGTVDNSWEFYLNFRDNTEVGKTLDRSKSFSPKTGVNVLKNESDLIDYSETRGGMTFNWNTGNITAAKDFINIGSSRKSSVVLSDKTPSFPFLRLEFYPTDWFRYNFIHAWLKSNLIDSSTVRYTGVESTLLNRSLSYSALDKYYVSHVFSIKPFEDLWLSFGESIIYGDNVEFIYYLPVFYRMADHYTSIGGGDTGDNAQIFFNTSYTNSEIESKYYLTFFIDEMSLTDIIKGSGDNANVFAWTLGWSLNNPLWGNSMMNIEYNAIKPYAYMNGDPLHSYASAGYQLGHWIGSNAVQYILTFEQYLQREIKLETFFQLIQKGSKENITDYYNRVKSTYPLLSGKISEYQEFGLNLFYNPVHDLYFNLSYSNIIKSTGRFSEEYNLSMGSSLTIGFRYGL